MCGDYIAVVKMNNVHIDKKQFSTGPWTDDEDQILIECTKNGLSDIEITNQLPGRNEKAVYMRKWRLRKRGQMK